MYLVLGIAMLKLTMPTRSASYMYGIYILPIMSFVVPNTT